MLLLLFKFQASSPTAPLPFVDYRSQVISCLIKQPKTPFNMVLAGGHSNPKPGDEEAQSLADSLRGEAEELLRSMGKIEGALEEFVVEAYTTQVVAGLNYRMKVRVGGDKYVHLHVFQPLPHTGEAPQLNSVSPDKTKEDALA